MDILFIALGVLGFAALVLLVGAYYAYRRAFYSKRRERTPYFGLEKGGFREYKEKIYSLIDGIIDLPYESVEITSRDGLKLCAKYYHRRDGAPLEIHCHGYKSLSLRDFAGGVGDSAKRGNNLLLIDQRAHGDSEGKVISFGINERFDLLEWIKYGIERFGRDVDIFLVGVSMGGATVLMAAGEEMPENVRCIVADCPYSSPLEIIVKVGAETGFPSSLAAPLVRLGARLFGHFSVTEASAVEAVRRAKVPILLIHGDADTFVPYEMSVRIAKENPKIRFETFGGADHGLSYFAETDRYLGCVLELMNSTTRVKKKDV